MIRRVAATGEADALKVIELPAQTTFELALPLEK
jgi:hypothetical protein